MTARRAGVREGLAGDRNELPVVARRVQGQAKYAERGAVANLAVRLDGAPTDEALATRPDHELADAAYGVGYGAGRLRAEALVDVIVAVQHQVRISVVEVLEERAGVGVVAGLTRAEAGVVPE